MTVCLVNKSMNTTSSTSTTSTTTASKGGKAYLPKGPSSPTSNNNSIVATMNLPSDMQQIMQCLETNGVDLEQFLTHIDVANQINVGQSLSSTTNTPSFGGRRPRTSGTTATGRELTPLDVIFGRGNKVSGRTGNWFFRQVIVLNKNLYKDQSGDGEGKRFIGVWLMECLHAAGVRFLEPQPQKKGSTSVNKPKQGITDPSVVYSTVPWERVREKVMQSLRESKWKKFPELDLRGLLKEIQKANGSSISNNIAKKERIESKKRVHAKMTCEPNGPPETTAGSRSHHAPPTRNKKQKVAKKNATAKVVTPRVKNKSQTGTMIRSVTSPDPTTNHRQRNLNPPKTANKKSKAKNSPRLEAVTSSQGFSKETNTKSKGRKPPTGVVDSSDIVQQPPQSLTGPERFLTVGYFKTHFEGDNDEMEVERALQEVRSEFRDRLCHLTVWGRPVQHSALPPRTTAMGNELPIFF